MSAPADLPPDAPGAPDAPEHVDVADLETLTMRLRFLDLWVRHDPASLPVVERDRRRIRAALERRGLRPVD